MRNPASPPNLFTYTMSIEIERAQAITWIRIQMAQHGLTLVQLAGRRLLCRAAATTTGGGVLSQHAGAGLGRPRRHGCPAKPSTATSNFLFVWAELLEGGNTCRRDREPRIACFQTPPLENARGRLTCVLFCQTVVMK